MGTCVLPPASFSLYEVVTRTTWSRDHMPGTDSLSCLQNKFQSSVCITHHGTHQAQEVTYKQPVVSSVERARATCVFFISSLLLPFGVTPHPSSQKKQNIDYSGEPRPFAAFLFNFLPRTAAKKARSVTSCEGPFRESYHCHHHRVASRETHTAPNDDVSASR